METLLAFVSEHTDTVLAAIIGVFSIYFCCKPENTEMDRIMKKIAYVLIAVVIIVCFRSFIQTPPPGKVPETTGTAPPLETTQPTRSGSVDVSQLLRLTASDYSMIEASSTYSGDKATHLVKNLIDNDPKTNWTEGVAGNGEGEYIDFAFPRERAVGGFVIKAGNHASETYYAKNARPKTIMLTFSDGSSQEFTLTDFKTEQTVTFDEIVYTTSLRLTIQSVYPGSAWTDTVISDFTVLAYQ